MCGSYRHSPYANSWRDAPAQRQLRLRGFDLMSLAIAHYRVITILPTLQTMAVETFVLK